MATSTINGIVDSGWQSVRTATSAGTVWYRKIGKIVYLQCYGVTANHLQIIYTLPVGFRPGIRWTVPASFPLDGGRVYVNMETTGTMTTVRDGATSMVNMYCQTAYPI